MENEHPGTFDGSYRQDCVTDSTATENQTDANETAPVSELKIRCKYPIYGLVDERRKSFPNYPGCIPVQNLAEAGFAYTGTGNSVRCFSCGREFTNLTVGDDPWHEHAKGSPDCAFIRAIKGEDFIQTVHYGAGHGNAVPTYKNMAHPEYASLHARMATFNTWPNVHTPKPEDLAAAGLFYSGHGDFVRCFFCGVALNNWTDRDQPMNRHAAFSETCPVVQLSNQTEIAAAGEDGENMGPLTGREMQDLLTETAAESCLEMYSKQEVEKGIQEYVKQTGKRDFNGAKLAGIIEELNESGAC